MVLKYNHLGGMYKMTKNYVYCTEVEPKHEEHCVFTVNFSDELFEGWYDRGDGKFHDNTTGEIPFEHVEYWASLGDM